MTSWMLLLLAIVLEICGTTCMKLSEGFRRPLPSVLLFVFYAACFTVFTFAIRRIDLSTAYAVWAGLGTAIIAGIGFFVFHEAVTPSKVVYITLIIVGVVGLKAASPS